MPTVSRWFLKTGMVYLALGLMAGVAQPLGALLNVEWLTYVPLPTYVHLIVVGWLTQLIFGVAFWMFPKYSKENPLGSPALAWATYWMLNAGLALRVIAEPALTAGAGAWANGALAISAGLQWGAGLSFIANTWRRVRPI